MNKKNIIFLIYIFSIPICFSQDPQFSQFYANPLYLAPSFAGATEENRLTLNYRNQWPAIPDAFVTYSFSYDRFFSNFNSGVGLLVMRDRAGAGHLSSTIIGLQYSFDFQINDDWHARPGLSFMYSFLGLNWNRLLWSSELSISGAPGTGEAAVAPDGDYDLNVSGLVYNQRLWFGLSVDHLLRPQMGFYDTEETKTPMKYSVFGGAQVIRKGRLLKPIEESLSIAVLFKHQDKFNQLDIGLYWYKNPLVLGLWYRGLPILDPQFGDAVILLAGFKTQYLHIGYSFDFTINNMVISNTGGTHEVSLVYEFRISQKKKKKKIHAMPCPEF